jgi:hypothetical protein
VERVAEGAEAQRVQVAAHLAHPLLLGEQQRLGDGQQRREALMQRVGVRLRETLIVISKILLLFLYGFLLKFKA